MNRAPLTKDHATFENHVFIHGQSIHLNDRFKYPEYLHVIHLHCIFIKTQNEVPSGRGCSLLL